MMNTENNNKVITSHATPATTDPETVARREFLKKLGKAGATAPAAYMLLSANLAAAQPTDTYGGSGNGSGSS